MSNIFLRTLLIVGLTSYVYGELLIFGGKKVHKNDNYQFIVSIYFSSNPICGGSLITFGTVLTAAHCFDEFRDGKSELKHYAVKGATANLNRGGITKNVSEITLHPKYKVRSFSHDIAIVKLSDFFKNEDDVHIIKIAPINFSWPVGDTATVFGWGRTERNNYPNHLQFTNITLMRKDYCLQLLYTWRKQIEEEMQCGGVKEGGRDACDGDSGGPLVHFATSYLIGIVSWGKDCAVARTPGVYAEVSAFNNWIRENASI